jgi:hypothetical protein
MKFPRVRFTVRQSMTVVIISALAFALGIEGMRLARISKMYRLEARQHTTFRNLAMYNAERDLEHARALEAEAPSWVEMMDKAKSGIIDINYINMLQKLLVTQGEEARRTRRSATYQRKMADHYGQLVEKYTRAANRPWQSFEADPPEPWEEEFSPRLDGEWPPHANGVRSPFMPDADDSPEAK